MEHQKSYFWFPMLSDVTMATSFSESTRDFLKTSFHMFPYNKILKSFESNIWLNIWNNHSKILPNAKFQPNQQRDLGVTSIWNLGFCCWLKYRLWCHNYIIVVMSQTFWHQCVEYVKLDTSANFMIIGTITTNLWGGDIMPPPPPPPWLMVKKSPCQIV